MKRTIRRTMPGTMEIMKMPHDGRRRGAQRSRLRPSFLLAALHTREKQNAPEARLRTRGCHSALNAMRHASRKRKLYLTYSGYSRVRVCLRAEIAMKASIYSRRGEYEVDASPRPQAGHQSAAASG